MNYSTSIAEFTDGSGDFFLRTDGSNIGSFVQYGNRQGSSFFAAMDIDGEGASLPVRMSFAGIDIRNYTDLRFSAFWAEDDAGTSHNWDSSDYVHVSYRIDNGGFQELFWLENDGSTFNSAALIDTNFDGVGDADEITSAFTRYEVALPGSGDVLDLVIDFNLNAVDEDIAIDNLRISGLFAIPEPSSLTHLACMLAFGTLLTRRRHRC